MLIYWPSLKIENGYIYYKREQNVLHSWFHFFCEFFSQNTPFQCLAGGRFRITKRVICVSRPLIYSSIKEDYMPQM